MEKSIRDNLLQTARFCALSYCNVVKATEDSEKERQLAFMAGYLKCAKDVGYDVTEGEDESKE